MGERNSETDAAQRRRVLVFDVALVAFNVIMIAMIYLFGHNARFENVGNLAGVNSLGTAARIITLSGLWAIGNMVLLLGLSNACRDQREGE